MLCTLLLVSSLVSQCQPHTQQSLFAANRVRKTLSDVLGSARQVPFDNLAWKCHLKEVCYALLLQAKWG